MHVRSFISASLRHLALPQRGTPLCRNRPVTYASLEIKCASLFWMMISTPKGSEASTDWRPARPVEADKQGAQSAAPPQ